MKKFRQKNPSISLNKINKTLKKDKKHSIKIQLKVGNTKPVK